MESGGQSSRRGGRHPDGATLGLEKTKQRGNPNSGAQNFGLFSLFSHHPVVPGEHRLMALPGPPAPSGMSVCAAPGQACFLFKVAVVWAVYREMTPFPRGT